MLAESPQRLPHPIDFPCGGQAVVREVICGLSPRVSLAEQVPDRENKKYKSPEVER